MCNIVLFIVANAVCLFSLLCQSESCFQLYLLLALAATEHADNTTVAAILSQSLKQ